MNDVKKPEGEFSTSAWIRVISQIYWQRQIKPQVFLTMLAKECDINYAWVSKIVNAMKIRGLVTTRKIGRQLIIYLTPQGFEVAKAAKLIEDVSNGNYTARVEKDGARDLQQQVRTVSSENEASHSPR